MDATQAQAKAEADAKAKLEASLASQGVPAATIPKVDPGAAKSVLQQWADLRGKDPVAAAEFYLKNRAAILPNQ